MDDSEKIRVSVGWMEREFTELNERLFGGELPTCRFEVMTSGRGSQGRVLGQFEVCNKMIRGDRWSRRMFYDDTATGKRIWIDKGNFVDLCNPCIRMNGNYTATESSLRATLVHEMCHLYNYCEGWYPSKAHGSEFMEAARMVASRSGGEFNVQRVATAEEMSGYELDPEIAERNRKRAAARRETVKSSAVAIFTFLDNGEIQLSVTSNKIANAMMERITDYYGRVGNLKSVKYTSDPSIMDVVFGYGYKKVFKNWRYWNIEGRPLGREVGNFILDTYHGRADEGLSRIVEGVIDEFVKDAEGGVLQVGGINLGLESPAEADIENN